MRLKSAFRVALYGIFALLFVSGVVWMLADKMKYDAEADTEMWQQAASFLLTLHGGAAMVTLMLLGALGPMHVQRAWRARTNRTTGIASITLYGLLIATAFGLYYLGSEAVRPWISYVHIAFGSPFRRSSSPTSWSAGPAPQPRKRRCPALPPLHRCLLPLRWCLLTNRPRQFSATFN
jgi:hypothetical protein